MLLHLGPALEVGHPRLRDSQSPLQTAQINPQPPQIRQIPPQIPIKALKNLLSLILLELQATQGQNGQPESLRFWDLFGGPLEVLEDSGEEDLGVHRLSGACYTGRQLQLNIPHKSSLIIPNPLFIILIKRLL